MLNLIEILLINYANKQFLSRVRVLHPTQLHRHFRTQITFIQLIPIVYDGFKVVYTICGRRERHNTGYRSVEQLIRIMHKEIRNRITSLRYKEDHKLVGLMQRWFEVTA